MVLVLSVGALECLVGHPLDTVRVRIISRAGAGAAGGAYWWLHYS